MPKRALESTCNALCTDRYKTATITNSNPHFRRILQTVTAVKDVAVHRLFTPDIADFRRGEKSVICFSARVKVRRRNSRLRAGSARCRGFPTAIILSLATRIRKEIGPRVGI